MDLLQLSLLLLIVLLGIFLSISGLQVFFILRDLKKALDRFNQLLASGDALPDEAAKQNLKKVTKAVASRRLFKNTR